MNYFEATRSVLLKRVIGLAVLVLCAVVTLISMFKFLYFGFDQGGPLLTGLAQTLKRLVYEVYEKTQYLAPIWDHAPVPNQKDLLSSGNIFFLIWYLGIFVGLSILRAAHKLAARLRRIDLEIEDELIQQSVRNAPRRNKEQIEESTDVPRQSAWKEIHTLYLAPVVVGLVLLVLGKLLG